MYFVLRSLTIVNDHLKNLKRPTFDNKTTNFFKNDSLKKKKNVFNTYTLGGNIELNAVQHPIYISRIMSSLSGNQFTGLNWNNILLHLRQIYVSKNKIQGYPQRLRLQRRLYGIKSVCFLIFMEFAPYIYDSPSTVDFFLTLHNH